MTQYPQKHTFLHFTSDDGSFIDVEVQVRPQEWFADRCLYYSTFAIQNQIKEGSDDYLLKPVYVVSIDDFSRKHSAGWDDRVLSSYSLREDENQELMTDNLHFVFIELSKFKKQWEDIDNDKERLYFCIKHLHEFDRLPEGFKEGIWAKLSNQAMIMEMEPEVRNQYLSIMETEIDKRAQMKYAKNEGKEEGLAKGKEEVARKMKSMGLHLETICEATGLTMEFVLSL
ncbi:MAG: Rpn family recombination-promoting nuclease/putative transposase [Bacteroidia bacterium]|nr:Rpn family recombination-promoting nuclease/putative transposase [Bacteroidia bacterium]